MTQDPVRMENSDSEEMTIDLVQRLKRVENWIDEVSRSRGSSRSRAIGIIPTRKVKREWPRRRSLSRSSESESESDLSDMITKKIHGQPLRGSCTLSQMKKLKVENVTAEGRKDSPEAVRVIELLQPALESGFEAAKAIAAITAKELRKAHFEEEEKERLRGLFCSYALIADCISHINLLKVIPQSNWENVKGFLEGGTSKDVPESLMRLVESTSFFRSERDVPGGGASPVSPTAFGLISTRSGRARRYSSGMSTQGFVYRQLQKRGFGGSFTNFRERRKSTQAPPQCTLAPVGRLAPITAPLPPAPPRIQ